MKKKVAILLLVLLMIGSLFSVAVIGSETAEDLRDTEIVPADESVPDGAYGATNPSYRISDSPYLRLPDDMKNWPPVVPPEPREVEGMEDPTAVVIYNSTTGKTVRIPSNDTTQQPVESGLNSTLPYQGLLPPGIVPESVFPPDDRVRVTSTDTYPWRTVCRLFITASDGTHWMCSGAIIGCPDGHGYHVLTAGHCIYMHDHGGWASSVKVVPGLDDSYKPYNYAWKTNMRSYTGWTVYQDHRYDWAVLTLDRNVGDYTGWMGRQTASSSSSIYTGILNTAGYPSDKGGLTMWFDSDYGRTANEYNHWYYMDTYGGQSGSPVWRYDGSNRYILTVHAYGNDGSGSNHGTRLNQDKFDRIITWCNADTPPTDKADLIDDGQSYSGFSPTTLSPGDSFHVWCDVRNVGTASSGGFYVSYYASTNTYISTSDYIIGTDYVSSISPFNYRDSDWSGTFPSIPDGTYYVGWIIDSGEAVTEFDETNNVAYKDSYQLVVTSPTCDGTDTSCGIYPSCENCNAKDGCYAYSTGCEERNYYCKSNEDGCKYTYSNRYTDYYDGWVYYCSGDSVRKHRLFHNFYCDGGTCKDHTSWKDDQLVENCNDYDGWVDTGDTKWVNDSGNECKEKEQKKQEYRDYTCSAGSCDYTVTDTRWIDTGNTKNKDDGTDCGLDYYDDWVTYCKGDEVWKHRLYHDFYCEGGTCKDHTSWVDDQLMENCNDYDNCYAYGNGCEDHDYHCSGGSCTYEYSNRHTDYYDDWEYYCQGDEMWRHRLFHDFYCDGGSCTDHTSWKDEQLVENCNDYDDWVDTGNTKWVNDLGYECKEKEQKEQEYRDYTCSGGSCDYTVTEIQWIDTGNTRDKPDGTICGCTANNTLKRCYDGACTDTGICNSTYCDADVGCDGKKPGESCGANRKCNSTCNCVLALGMSLTSPENRTYASNCVRLNYTVEPAGTVLDWTGYSLDGGANETVTGNTTVRGLSACGHNIVVYANDTNGNMAASNTVFFTTHPGDISGDGVVNIFDLQRLAWAFNTKPGDPDWNEEADLNCDNKVNVFDLQILGWNFGNDYTVIC